VKIKLTKGWGNRKVGDVVDVDPERFKGMIGRKEAVPLAEKPITPKKTTLKGGKNG
jgi:hypothetical protein